MRDTRSVGPSRWYYPVGAAVILARLVLFLYTLLHGIFHITDGLTRIVLPGAKDLTLRPKLRYTIFLETESVVDGRIYSTIESVSGLACVVTSQTSGNKIMTHEPAMSTTYTVGGRNGKSVLEFITKEAGVYHMACDYPEGRSGPQAVLAVGFGVGEEIFSMVMKSLLSFFGGGFLGAGIITRVLILRERAQKQLARANPALL